MSLPSTGPIGLKDINVEKGLNSNTPGTSLQNLSTTNIASASTSKPDGVAPHKISEFYGYNHAAGGGNPMANALRVGPYAGMSNRVGIGPGSDTSGARYNFAGINPHSESDLEATIAFADANDILLLSVTENSTPNFGSNTSAGFNLQQYQDQVGWCSQFAFYNDAVARGRVLNYIGDECYHDKWKNSQGVATWTPDLVNQCGLFHKGLWPNSLTFVRVNPNRLRFGWGGFGPPSGGWTGLDYGWMQYEGPQAQAGLSFATALSQERTDANAINIGCAASLNIWAGGNHTTVNGINQCWDIDPDNTGSGIHSGVIAGAVQGSGSSGSGLSSGQNLTCSQWSAVANKKTLVASPSWIKNCIDVVYSDLTLPFFALWSYATVEQGIGFAVPYQDRADFVSALDYAIAKGLSRPTFSGLRTPK